MKHLNVAFVFSFCLSLSAGAGLPVSALTLESSVVNAAGGTSTGSGNTLIGSVGQGQPVGYLAGSSEQLYAGFLNTFLLQPDTDTDQDGIADENDLDDDGDALDDLTELAGTGFNPITPSNPLDPDSDDDGSFDGEEQAAGTNPGDGGSMLAITSVIDSGGMVTVTWQARAGTQYVLQQASSVAGLDAAPLESAPYMATGGSGFWQETQGQLQATSPLDFNVYRIKLAP